MDTSCLRGALALSILIAVVPASAIGPGPDVIQGPPEGWQIVMLTDDPDQDRHVAMNNRGQIVFSKRILPNPDGTNEEIFLYENGKLRQLTFNDLEEHWPGINDSGTITWARRDLPFGGDWEIVRFEHGVEEQITDNSVYDVTPSIGDSGIIVWPSGGDPDTLQLFAYRDGDITQVTNNGLSNQCITINAADDLAWVRYDFNAKPFWLSTIMCSIDGDVHELTDGATQAQGCGINDAGIVTWSDDPGVMLWNDGDLLVLPDSFNGRGPRINNVEEVVYALWLGEFWTAALFTGEHTYHLFDSVQQESHGFDIADSGELAFAIGDFPELDIAILWRIRDPGDFTGDGLVNVFDFHSMRNCMSNVECGVQMPPVCLDMFDFDVDGDIDFHDFGSFQRLVTPNP